MLSRYTWIRLWSRVSNADWTCYQDTRGSTSGYLVYLGSNLISWCPFILKMVSLLLISISNIWHPFFMLNWHFRCCVEFLNLVCNIRLHKIEFSTHISLSILKFKRKQHEALCAYVFFSKRGHKVDISKDQYIAWNLITGDIESHNNVINNVRT